MQKGFAARIAVMPGGQSTGPVKTTATGDAAGEGALPAPGGGAEIAGFAETGGAGRRGGGPGSGEGGSSGGAEPIAAPKCAPPGSGRKKTKKNERRKAAAPATPISA